MHEVVVGLQRSSPPKLEVFQTVEKGWGVRAAVDLPKGAFVCCYLGEALSWKRSPQPELCFVKQLSQPQRQIDKRYARKAQATITSSRFTSQLKHTGLERRGIGPAKEPAALRIL